MKKIMKKIKLFLTPNNWELIYQTDVNTTISKTFFIFEGRSYDVTGELNVYVERKKKKFTSIISIYGETEYYNTNNIFKKEPLLKSKIMWAFNTDLNVPLCTLIQQEINSDIYNSSNINNITSGSSNYNFSDNIEDFINEILVKSDNEIESILLNLIDSKFNYFDQNSLVEQILADGRIVPHLIKINGKMETNFK